jgi:hypothetical protein
MTPQETRRVGRIGADVLTPQERRLAIREADAWADLRHRRTFLYGDADARLVAAAPDLAKWNALGDPIRTEAQT